MKFQIFPDRGRSSPLIKALEEGTLQKGAQQQDSVMFVQLQAHSVGQVVPSDYLVHGLVTSNTLTGEEAPSIRLSP